VIVQRKDGLRRMPDDVYLTDLGTIRRSYRRFLELWRYYTTAELGRPVRIFDPGAGTGHWGQVAREFWPDAHITGLDKRDLPHPESYDRWLPETLFPDCLAGLPERAEWWPSTNPWDGPFDLVAGNPPFGLAEEFIRGALTMVPRHGQVLFLLPLRFLEGIGRATGLLAEHPPRFVHVCSKRPSFQADGKSNTVAFAVFNWQKGWQGYPEITLMP
jgi:hypothetical protein